MYIILEIILILLSSTILGGVIGFHVIMNSTLNIIITSTVFALITTIGIIIGIFASNMLIATQQ